MFSIVIPLYNKELYISKTLTSVLEQTYFNYEVLIVNDGSTDKSVEVVQSFIDDRIRIIHQANQGVSVARNIGIEKAKYELIAFLDADDWWDKSYLESMLEIINKYPVASIFASQYAVVKDNIIYPSRNYFEDGKTDDCYDMYDNPHFNKFTPIQTSGIIVKKSILEKSGLFDARIKYYEDADFVLRIGCYTHLAYLQKGPLTFYNNDVEKAHRATGKKHPLSTHLITYLDKYNVLYLIKPQLKCFIDEFSVKILISYKDDWKTRTIRKQIFSTIEKKNLSFRMLLQYYYLKILFIK